MTINKTSYGFALGLILPALTMLLAYEYAYGARLEFFEFMQRMVMIRGAAMYLAMCCLSNLAVFLAFAYSDKLNIARGILMATIIYALVVVVVKFIIQDF